MNYIIKLSTVPAAPGAASPGACAPSPAGRAARALAERSRRFLWSRTNGVNTIGAAAKVTNFDRLGKKVRPGTVGKIKVG